MSVFDQLDNLDKCPFCDVKLVTHDIKDNSFECAGKACPTNNEHFWALDYYGDGIDILNIQCNGYQLHWNNTEPNEPKTELFDPNIHMLYDNIISFPYLLDFSLTKQNIEDKIKLLLTFM